MTLNTESAELDTSPIDVIDSVPKLVTSPDDVTGIVP